MIDWNLVGEKRIVIRVPTEDTAAEFFDELLKRYPTLCIPSEYVINRLRKYGDDAAIYIAPRFDSRGFHWEYSSYDWYATTTHIVTACFASGWPLQLISVILAVSTK